MLKESKKDDNKLFCQVDMYQADSNVYAQPLERVHYRDVLVPGKNYRERDQTYSLLLLLSLLSPSKQKVTLTGIS